MTSDEATQPLEWPNPEHGAKGLIEFLRKILPRLQPPRIKYEIPETWSTITLSVLRMQAGFPFPAANIKWDSTTNEKIEFVNVSTEITHMVFRNLEGIYHGSEKLMKKLWVIMLETCMMMDIWIDLDLPNDPQLPSPTALRLQVMNTLVDAFKGLCDANNPGDVQQGLDLLRTLALETRTVVESQSPANMNVR